MPRLTNTHYFEIHYWLRQCWLENTGSFAGLTRRDQMDLHEFFAPAEDSNDMQLIEHRR